MRYGEEMRVDKHEDYSHSMFMAVVQHSTQLDASVDVIWNAVKTPSAFRRVTRGLLRMPIIQERDDEWREGETVVGWVFLFGFIPFSRHHLHIARIDESLRVLSSREHGGLIRVWNHDIEVTAIHVSTCRYRDRIEIKAGLMTPVIVFYAHWFYRMRQRRWRAIAVELSR
jgi:hypothetical protein